jgi:hypothetical protein
MNGETFLDFMVDDEIQILQDDRHPAIKELVVHQEKIGEIIKKVEILIIYDKTSCDAALRLSAESKEIFQNMESFRKKTLEPYRKFIAGINECASNLKKSLEYIDATIKVKLAGWHQLQERQHLEALESTREFTQSLGLELPVVMRETPKNASCEAATAYTRDKVTFEIEDESLVPDEYWVIDFDSIQKHIALGKKDIPGVKIKVEKVMTIRRK